MKTVEALLVHSFTKEGSGGNPAGVVLNADGLSNKEKLAIAQAVGFSETAFVAQDDEVDFDVSFFTTTDEVDFCGHATLAAFSVMHQEGIITSGKYCQRTKAGLLEVSVEPDGQVVMEQKLPEYGKVLDADCVSELIGLDSAALKSTQLPIEIISTGLADIMVSVPLGSLDNIQVNEKLTIEFCKQHNVVGIHAFELCENGEVTAHCRNFAPLFGISEESATGSSSGALACYLTKYLASKYSGYFVFEQGRAMGCSSRLTAFIDSNEANITKVCVGGFAHKVGAQKMSV